MSLWVCVLYIPDAIIIAILLRFAAHAIWATDFSFSVFDYLAKLNM